MAQNANLILIFEILIKFGCVSGCTINWDKSKAFYIGASKHWSNIPLSHLSLQWTLSTIHYLGLTIPNKQCNYRDEIFRLNFDGYCHNLILF